MTIDRMWELRRRVMDHLARAEVDGVVITHGTDAIEETAYLITRSIRTDKAVVVTGAMRTSNEPGWDGPGNLAAAVRVAASPGAAGAGVLVVMADRIFAAADVTKSHTHALDSFESPTFGPVGIVDDDRVIFRRTLAGVPRALCPDAPAQPVDIVYAYAGADSRLLDSARVEGKGLVVAAMGRGNVPPAMVSGIERWIADDKAVVVTSRSLRGRVGRAYGYDGGSARLAELGAIFAGPLRPQQARIDLMLALGAGMVIGELRALFEAL
jgi:L-asparaginase